MLPDFSRGILRFYNVTGVTLLTISLPDNPFAADGTKQGEWAGAVTVKGNPTRFCLQTANNSHSIHGTVTATGDGGDITFSPPSESERQVSWIVGDVITVDRLTLKG